MTVFILLFAGVIKTLGNIYQKGNIFVVVGLFFIMFLI